MAATQALVWAWVSDPDRGSTVFSSVAGGLDDPLNWDGLTPSAHTDASADRADSALLLTSTVALGLPLELTPILICRLIATVGPPCSRINFGSGPWTLEQSADQAVVAGAHRRKRPDHPMLSRY